MPARQADRQWELSHTFESIYTLLWKDVNYDGVEELLVASSSGVYIFEADSAFLLLKLEALLELSSEDGHCDGR